MIAVSWGGAPQVSRPEIPSLHDIAAQVREKHGVKAVDFFSQRRDRVFAKARHEFCWRARNETRASYPEIGRFLKRDHTTVIHAIRRHEERMKAAVNV